MDVNHSIFQFGSSEVITLLVLGIGFTAWLIRLESKTINTERNHLQIIVEVKEIRARHDLVSEKLAESMSYIREALAEIRGRLTSKEEKKNNN
jgi:hypothetical protein